MDDLVRAAMAKWPNVPACHGWLGLDARGQWYMRDERAQAAGSFQCGSSAARGAVLRHEKLIEFIQRNYERDDMGRWYFQNGPQRVYVELMHTPWIARLQPDGSAHLHDGQKTAVKALWLDEEGWPYLETERGLALLHTQDVHFLPDVLERVNWPQHAIARADLPQRFGYVLSPAAQSA